MSHLPERLKSLVNESVAILGQVIFEEASAHDFELIEAIRHRMTLLRNANDQKKVRILNETFQNLVDSPISNLRITAHAFSMMLELMNACENAYRTYSLKQHQKVEIKTKPRSIVYVLTAHPTEARNPQNIQLFQKIGELLLRALEVGIESQTEFLKTLLKIAWHTPITRHRKPNVRDEAEHIFSILLKREILDVILRAGPELYSTYIHTWVGGDKDGHPGVHSKVMLQSFQISRGLLIKYILDNLEGFRSYSNVTLTGTKNLEQRRLVLKNILALRKNLLKLKNVKSRDAAKVKKLKLQLTHILKHQIKNHFGLSTELSMIERVFSIFPGLVVPLEFRESADLVVAASQNPKFAISKMFSVMKNIAKGGDPRWYARSFVISQTHSIDDIRAARILMQRFLGSTRLPIVPLFEQKQALVDSVQIVTSILKDKKLRRAIKTNWNQQLEVMLGYSDSSKEIGVLASRIEIAKAIQGIDRLCRKAKVTPVFFHGSGGSVDRGGGSISEQTSWWPASAFWIYKVTIQGEMVERTLSTPEIVRGQLEKIGTLAENNLRLNRKPISVPESLQAFGKSMSKFYQAKVNSSEFLAMIAEVTPYSYLSAIKIGSRPTKRGKIHSVMSLRAIPWILCWTQTRILFPTWWGAGSAWNLLSQKEKSRLCVDFKKSDFFQSYIKQLGFTLKKIDLSIFEIYLQQSNLPQKQANDYLVEFRSELKKTITFFRAVSGQRDLLYYRPWLGESISLRSPMIHPLNLIQIISMRKTDPQLLRETLAGIATGMMTTG